LKQDIHFDFSVFFSGFWVVDVPTTIKICNYYNTLLVMVVVEKPPKVIRKRRV